MPIAKVFFVAYLGEGGGKATALLDPSLMNELEKEGFFAEMAKRYPASN